MILNLWDPNEMQMIAVEAYSSCSCRTWLRAGPFLGARRLAAAKHNHEECHVLAHLKVESQDPASWLQAKNRKVQESSAMESEHRPLFEVHVTITIVVGTIVQLYTQLQHYYIQTYSMVPSL